MCAVSSHPRGNFGLCRDLQGSFASRGRCISTARLRRGWEDQFPSPALPVENPRRPAPPSFAHCILITGQGRTCTLTCVRFKWSATPGADLLGRMQELQVFLKQTQPVRGYGHRAAQPRDAWGTGFVPILCYWHSIGPVRSSCP